MDIIFCRIGWMISYNGAVSEKPQNGGSYNINHIGHETYNFRSFHGKYYGYVQSKNDHISVKRFSNNNYEYAQNVLTVWVSTNPGLGGQYIVGWYKNSKIYREHQTVPQEVMEERELKDHNMYNIYSEDVCLLEPVKRMFQIPSGKNNGFGMSNVWYGNSEINKAVEEYINSYEEDYIFRINKIESGTKDLFGDEKEAIVKTRINQDKFRAGLLERDKKCCLCGVDNPDLLIASHIKPWAKSDKHEKLDIGNGLLLCPNHDKLFDPGFISFDSKGKILISKKLTAQNITFMNINDSMKIEITEENSVYLDYHRKHVFVG